MEKKIAAIQSNYIPWKGYFDIINSVDVFVIYDHVQYTKNDWRNRNKIKTHQGTKWITIPVHHNINNKICDTFTTTNLWRRKHWNMFLFEYKKAKHFNTFADYFKDLYLENEEKNLSRINISFIKRICKILDIKTEIIDSYMFKNDGDKTERLVDLCKSLNAKSYLSGPSGKDYINEKYFNNNNIKVEFIEYNGYKEYDQIHPPFEHYVSIIDLILNEGTNAKKYMLSY